ncbi:membrane-associated oxidoreductase [Streptomyces sp. NPDC057302]|uniref:membrane-associated oxidoreductase n=1 Tax=Streptomyces sp. NPDC057302 TaxID=3346094 RepID=UPI003627BCC6
MEITDLTPAERRVWQAFSLGDGVDFRARSEDGESPGDDPLAGASWGPERTVRAEVLRALLLNGPTQDGEIAGMKLTGARITGYLNLMYGTVEHPVRLRSCHFDEAPNLNGAQIRTLALNDSVLPGFMGATLRVEQALRISCCRIAGPVRLAGAQITGAFFANGAELGTPPEPGASPALDPEAAAEAVLQLNHAVIGSDVWAPDLVAHGQVRMNGATVGGQVNLDGAELGGAGEVALEVETLSVGTDLRAKRLRARGAVNMSGARIPRHVNLAYARLSHPGGTALRASSCVIGELWLREAAPIQGIVNLRRSQVDLLYASPEVWPEQVKLDGLGYRRLAPDLPAEQRLPLLEREAVGYLPQSYEQLAAAYRTVGDEAGARTVQLAKLRRHRRTLPPYARIWGHLQDVTVGYGFRPMRAAGWLLVLLLTGALAFALHHPRPLKSDEAPTFNPVFYTLDLLLPIIGFGQESAFAPDGRYQWLSYLLVATGWVLVTTVAAGITRSLSRQ